MSGDLCPNGRTDYEACFAPFRYCPVKGCGRVERPPQRTDAQEEALIAAGEAAIRLASAQVRFQAAVEALEAANRAARATPQDPS